MCLEIVKLCLSKKCWVAWGYELWNGKIFAIEWLAVITWVLKFYGVLYRQMLLKGTLFFFWEMVCVLSCVWLFVIPWTVQDFPGKNTGVSCCFVLQGVFPTQGSSCHLWYLLHWQVHSLPLSTWKAFLRRNSP